MTARGCYNSHWTLSGSHPNGGCSVQGLLRRVLRRAPAVGHDELGNPIDCLRLYVKVAVRRIRLAWVRLGWIAAGEQSDPLPCLPASGASRGPPIGGWDVHAGILAVGHDENGNPDLRHRHAHHAVWAILPIADVLGRLLDHHIFASRKARTKEIVAVGFSSMIQWPEPGERLGRVTRNR